MKYNYDKEARRLIEAIRRLASNEGNLLTMETYLSFHFQDWMEKFANTPEGMADEFESFSKIGEWK